MLDVSYTHLAMKHYSKEFKEEALKLSDEIGVKKAAQQLGVASVSYTHLKIVIPMLARLKKCRDLVKLGTANELDLLDHPEYQQLQAF